MIFMLEKPVGKMIENAKISAEFRAGATMGRNMPGNINPMNDGRSI